VPSQIERAYGFPNGGAFHRMRVDHGGPDIAMPQQLLDGADVGVGLEQVAGKTVPKAMSRRPLADPGLPHRLLDRFLHLGFMQMIASVFFRGRNQGQMDAGEHPLPKGADLLEQRFKQETKTSAAQ